MNAREELERIIRETLKDYYIKEVGHFVTHLAQKIILDAGYHKHKAGDNNGDKTI